MVLGIFLRFYMLGSLPYGLNQDEASAGYDAWALLTSGIDRNGDSFPVLFTSWGSGQNVLMSYLAIPFIALFGLSEVTVRIPNALFGCITLLVFWLLARKIRGARFGLTALILLAVNPWHIMMSRWALESNLLPAFLLLGVYFTVLAKDRQWLLLPAAVSYALGIYAYGTAFFILPILLIGSIIWLRREIRWKPFTVSMLAFIIIALPIAVCQLSNVLGWGEIKLFSFTLPELTQTRQAATSVFGAGLGSVRENFETFFRILKTESDGLIFNSLGIMSGGMFYFFGLPLIIIGIIASLGRRKDFPGEIPMLIWAIGGAVCTGFIAGNINRLNFVWLPLIYFEAVGAHWILCKLRWLRPAAWVLLAACVCVFASSYVITFGGEGNANYFPGLCEAVEYCEEKNAESIYVTNYVNQPYIFALFASETPPENFVESVVYINENAAFRGVSSFGKYTFGPAEMACGDYAIVNVYELTTQPEVVVGKYAVIRPEVNHD